MTLGPVMLGLDGLTLSAEEREILEHPQVGAVILFARNFEAPEQVAELTASVRRAAGRHLLIAVDQEGGRVQRFRQGFTRLPAVGEVLPACDGDVGLAAALLRELGWLMASEVLAAGCDFSFAPVLDLGRGISSVIGTRAFAATAEQILPLADAYIGGMREAGMAATGKHFPGHGSTEIDSHVGFPVDERSRAAIMNEDVAAFRPFFDGRLQAVMPAHVIYPDVDDRPAGFSPVWVDGILRRELGFSGVVFSDDLGMKGAEVAGDHGERVKAALAAGCDMALVCNERDGAIQALDRLGAYRNPESAARLASMRARAFPASLRAVQDSSRAQAVRRTIAERFGELA